MAKYIPKCPNCGSANVKEISHSARGAVRGILLPFSAKKLFSDVDKNWHCNNCKRDF